MFYMLVALSRVYFKIYYCYSGIEWANKLRILQRSFKRCNSGPMDFHLNKIIELPMLPTLWNTLFSKRIKDTIEGINILSHIPLKLRSQP
jgi:hypothetical protein